MGRDNKKGRGGGGGRGAGKKMFIANIEEMEMRDREQEEHREERARRRADDEDAPAGKAAEDDDESEEEEVKPKKKESVFGFQRSAGDEEEADGLAGRAVNPNRQPKSTEGADPEAGMNRKEREALAAQKAKEDYMRRHLAGETEQARADLARLAIVRQRREEAAAKRKAEGRAPGWSATGVESSSDSDSDSDDDGPKKGKGKAAAGAKGATAAPAASAAPTKVTGAAAAAAAHAAAQAESAAAIAAKKKAAALGEGDGKAAAGDSASGPPKLSSMEIKKLNGDGLKEHLKARGLDVQGQKKDLMKRLQDYENAR